MEESSDLNVKQVLSRKQIAFDDASLFSDREIRSTSLRVIKKQSKKSPNNRYLEFREKIFEDRHLNLKVDLPPNSYVYSISTHRDNSSKPIHSQDQGEYTDQKLEQARSQKFIKDLSPKKTGRPNIKVYNKITTLSQPTQSNLSKVSKTLRALKQPKLSSKIKESISPLYQKTQSDMIQILAPRSGYLSRASPGFSPAKDFDQPVQPQGALRCLNIWKRNGEPESVEIKSPISCRMEQQPQKVVGNVESFPRIDIEKLNLELAKIKKLREEAENLKLGKYHSKSKYEKPQAMTDRQDYKRLETFKTWRQIEDDLQLKSLEKLTKKEIIQFKISSNDIQRHLEKKYFKSDIKEFIKPSSLKQIIVLKFLEKSYETLKNVLPDKGIQARIHSIFQRSSFDIQKGRKTVVLGLDHTLIYSKEGQTFENGHQIAIRQKNGRLQVVNFMIRPFSQELILRLSKHCDLVLFSDQDQQYTDRIAEVLDPQKKFTKRLCQSDCTKLGEGFLVKDISQLGKSLRDVVIVDSKFTSFLQMININRFQLSNAIPIIPYYGENQDDQLVQLYLFILLQVVGSDNVGELLSGYFQLHKWHQYQSGVHAVTSILE